MKKTFFSLLMFAFFLCSLGQTTDNSAKSSPRPKLEDMEVKDANGMVYPSTIWQQLLTSGKYGIKLMPDGKTALISKLSEGETNTRLLKLPKPVESKFFRTGEKIPSFKETDMNGNKYSLKELAGKIVVLNFWFINCPPCRKEIPDLNEVVESFKDNKDVVFIAVALDEKRDIQDFLKANPFTYSIIDNGRYIAQRYNVTSYPTHVVLDRQGKVAFHTSGLAMNTVLWVKKSIEAALNETVAPQ